MSFFESLAKKYRIEAGDVVKFPQKTPAAKSVTMPVFSDGQYTKAKDKELIYKALVNFIKNDFAQGKFTKSLYTHLSLNFGFIAHYDLHGFYQKRFADPEGRIKTYESISRAAGHDLNKEDCGDLNRAIKELVVKNEVKFVNDAEELKKKNMLEQHGKLTRELERMGHKFE